VQLRPCHLCGSCWCRRRVLLYHQERAARLLPRPASAAVTMRWLCHTWVESKTHRLSERWPRTRHTATLATHGRCITPLLYRMPCRACNPVIFFLAEAATSVLGSTFAETRRWLFIDRSQRPKSKGPLVVLGFEVQMGCMQTAVRKIPWTEEVQLEAGFHSMKACGKGNDCYMIPDNNQAQIDMTTLRMHEL